MLGLQPGVKKSKVRLCLQEQLMAQFSSVFCPDGQRSGVRCSSAGHRSGRCGQRDEPRWAEPRRWWPPGGWAEESPAPPAQTQTHSSMLVSCLGHYIFLKNPEYMSVQSHLLHEYFKMQQWEHKNSACLTLLICNIVAVIAVVVLLVVTVVAVIVMTVAVVEVVAVPEIRNRFIAK